MSTKNYESENPSSTSYLQQLRQSSGHLNPDEAPVRRSGRITNKKTDSSADGNIQNESNIRSSMIPLDDRYTKLIYIYIYIY
jgi:hypothetical protein